MTEPISFVEKYRPKTLADVLGQPDVIRALQLYAAAPYSAAFLFHGETGTGKTSAAHALAHDLGVAVKEAAFGGFYEIASGEMSADAVRREIAQLRYIPMMGSGHRVLIANESDRMLTQAETLWLDFLEHLPARCTLVFTTNNPDSLSKRFRDRCEQYRFSDDPKELQEPLKMLAQRIWKAEGLTGKCPPVKNLGVPPVKDLIFVKSASFRLAAQQMQRIVRAARAGVKDIGRVVEQVCKDVTAEEDWVCNVRCDHCKHAQDVPRHATSHVCVKCGVSFDLLD